MKRSFSGRSGSRWCFALFAVVACGCSHSGPEPTYSVRGTVKLASGEVLPGGQILFRPAEGSTYSARGDIASDGSFELTTFVAGDGAVAGKHKVMITPAVPPEVMEDARAMLAHKPAIDPRYGHLNSTPLEFTVSDSSANDFEIIVERPRR